MQVYWMILLIRMNNFQPRCSLACILFTTLQPATHQLWKTSVHAAHEDNSSVIRCQSFRGVLWSAKRNSIHATSYTHCRCVKYIENEPQLSRCNSVIAGRKKYALPSPRRHDVSQKEDCRVALLTGRVIYTALYTHIYQEVEYLPTQTLISCQVDELTTS
jgi:hypothetical protein